MMAMQSYVERKLDSWGIHFNQQIFSAYSDVSEYINFTTDSTLYPT